MNAAAEACIAKWRVLALRELMLEACRQSAWARRPTYAGYDVTETFYWRQADELRRRHPREG